jgi:hypothetical protein
MGRSRRPEIARRVPRCIGGDVADLKNMALVNELY